MDGDDLTRFEDRALTPTPVGSDPSVATRTMRFSAEFARPDPAVLNVGPARDPARGVGRRAAREEAPPR